MNLLKQVFFVVLVLLLTNISLVAQTQIILNIINWLIEMNERTNLYEKE